MSACLTELLLFSHSLFCYSFRPFTYLFRITEKIVFVNPEKPDVPLNKNDAFQKVQKRRVQEKR